MDNYADRLLAEIRALTTTMEKSPTTFTNNAEKLMARVADLDNHLTSGGQLPKDWQTWN